MYKIILSKRAQDDLNNLLKSEPQAYKKAIVLLKEIEQHPRAGKGKPQLKNMTLKAYTLAAKHRRVYSINDEIITVDIISAKGIMKNKHTVYSESSHSVQLSC